MKSKTTVVRTNKENNLLKIFNNISFLILNFRSNHKWLDGRELKKVSLITTSMKDKIMRYSTEAENSNTASNDKGGMADKHKGIKKREMM
jgi:hypothetical protein